jgi:biotin carboxyl carrier protein
MVDLDVDGRRCAVTVDARGDRWVATIDGRESEFDASRAGDRWSLLVGLNGQSARSYEVAVDEVRAGELDVRVNGHRFTVLAPPLRRFGDPSLADRGSRAGTGPFRITAPMPGRVVKVLVAQGALVSAGQPLVIVEAMKMENELRSPRAGRVAAVVAGAGTPVDAGTPLLILEPESPAPVDGLKEK